MTKKEYAEQQKDLVVAWNSYSLTGDVASARVVDQDVRKYMTEHNVKDYSEALRLRRREVQDIEAEFSHVPSVFENNMDVGTELHKVAMKNQEICPHLSYTQCYRAAIQENPQLGAIHVGRDVRTDLVGETRKFFDEQHKLRMYEEQGKRTMLQVVGNIISGQPKIPGTMEMDIEAILRALNSYGGDTLADAAKERLDVLTRDEINLTGFPASEVAKPEVMANIRRRVMSRFKDLADVANGGAINERGLRQLSPQHFK